jgi:hypothetical protein
MITEAIWEERKWNKGSSRSYIKKFILDHYEVDPKQLKDQLTSALADMLEPDTGNPCLVEIENNYKLTSDWRAHWRKRYGIKTNTKKKKKDKNAPKGPRNAYNFFIKTNHTRRMKEHPEKESMQITKLLAEEWKKLSSQKRQPYEEMAGKDRRRYDREMNEYKKKKKRKYLSDEESSSESEREKKKKRNSKGDSDSEEEKESEKSLKRKSSMTTDKEKDESQKN